MTDIYGDIYGDLYSAFPVMGVWTGAYAETASRRPTPGTASLQVSVANTAGDWMIAVVGWRCPPGYPVPSFELADDVHNWWEPLLPGSSTSSASGLTRCAIWMAPAARAAGFVMVAPRSYTPGFAVVIYDVAGMAPWVSTSAHTGKANNASSLAVTLGAPASQAFVVAGSASDSISDSIGLAGTGWSSPDIVSATNGTDSTSDIVVAAGFQLSSASTTATWSTGFSVNLSAATGAALTSAPALARINPAWPVLVYETAPGSGMQSPSDTMSWVPLTGQSMALDITQGRQYETGQLATGEGTLMLDNPLGQLVPPGTGNLAGISAGTPVRVRAAWTGGSWQMEFHGNGSTANPQASTNHVFAILPNQAYSSSAWLACSVPYTPGVAWLIAWYNSSGTRISSVSSPLVTGTVATLETVSGTSPSNAAYAAAIAQASGTPPSSTIFYASAAAPIP